MNHYKQGMTAIEILVVVVVLGIIFSITLPQFSKMRENQVLKNAVSDILSVVNKAQSKTLASEDSSSYGVHFESDKVIIFKGVSFVVGNVNNEIINIVSPANISNVTINGASGTSGDIYFNRLSGSLNNTGINTVTVSTPAVSKIITIYSTGVASVN